MSNYSKLPNKLKWLIESLPFLGIACLLGYVWIDTIRANSAFLRLLDSSKTTFTEKERGDLNKYYSLTLARRVQTELDVYLNPSRSSERVDKWYVSIPKNRFSNTANKDQTIQGLLARLPGGDAKVAVAVDNAIVSAGSAGNSQRMIQLCSVAIRDEKIASCGFITDIRPDEAMRINLGVESRRVISWDKD